MGTRILEDKIVLITGASSGIGAESAIAFAAEGAKVVVGYHRGQERAEQLVSQLPGTGHWAAPSALEDGQSHARLAARLQEAWGRLDVLVNSAGYTRKVAHADLDTMTPALFNEVLLANVGGPYAVTRSLIPLLRAAGGDAVVVNVSSVSAFTGSGSNLAYCAAKAALDTLTKSLARAFGPDVRFLSVSPAAVDTGFVEGRSREELLAKAKKTPLGRAVSPADVAQAILACATHLRTATGTRIVSDGGHTL
ncbi:SDR family NAD(P)-dependent oxidoreductase [Xylophilus sp.]|uniref:SDR family NAD(P)-dependent oxidoreductase n=1 Tax=Xylophilus sp. TaxID=2653893 RepID=UPI0013B91EDE|nr:SDR family oxidoreductase [Xylophilus sp.]KAF1042934.1 MAG: 3-alpha-hydroxycholanate dehydrogenase (NADP(+)) [Xylophilus sp.]